MFTQKNDRSTEVDKLLQQRMNIDDIGLKYYGAS